MTNISTRDAKNRLSEPTRRGFSLAAGEAYLRAKGIADPVPYIAEDFDAALPEDILLRPLPPAHEGPARH